MTVSDLLIGLVNQYSPSGEESAAVEYLVDQMRLLGLKAGKDGAGNAVGVCGEGPREIMLLGHIDTFPGLIPVRREGDRLYGRGSVDAKGPLAVFTSAAAALTPPPGWKITVVGAVGEESTSDGARYLLERYRPDYLIIGEPSGWETVCLGYKGSLTVNATLETTEAHSAAQPSILAPCDALFAFWSQVLARIEQLNPADARLFDQITPTIRAFSSESDGFLAKAQLSIAFRLPPQIAAEAFWYELVLMAGEDIRLHKIDGMDAYRAEKNTPLVRAMLAGIRSASGKPSFSVKTGSSDMNITAPVWQCPTVAYGPGDSSLDHTPEEHILLSELEQAEAVLIASLEKLFQSA